MQDREKDLSLVHIFESTVRWEERKRMEGKMEEREGEASEERKDR